MSGYTAAELQGMRIRDLECRESPEEIASHIRTLLASRQDRFESLHRRKDGSTFDVEVRIQVQPGPDSLMVAFIRDITERKLAERNLQESEERYRKLVEGSPDAIYIHIDGIIVFSNAAGLQLLGVDRPEELLGTAVMEWVHPEYREAARERIKRVLRQEETSQVIEYRLLRRDGTAVEVEVASIGSLYRGRPAVQVTARDISQRKQAERQLIHAHSLMDYVISHARSAIAVHDRDLNYVYVSQRYLDEYNVREKDIIGRHHYEIFPDLPQKWRDVHQRALQGEVSSSEEDPYIRADGNVEWTRWECRPWYEDDGSIGGFIIYTEVITPRKRAEDALRRSEARYRTLFEESGDYVLLLSPREDGPPLIADANEAALGAHGYSREELIGRPVTLLEPDLPPEAAKDRFDRISKGDLVTFEVRHHRKDGTSFDAEVRARLLHLEESDLIVSIERDITERKKTEAEKDQLREQLMQAQKMESVGRLAGGVAHDFNNMLGVILGHSQLALERLPPSDPLFADLKEIEKAALRSSDLTRQLLAFARRQAVAPQVLDLNMVVSGMLKMMQRLIGEDIRLSWKPAGSLWPVRIDPSQVDQILANLCVNARDAIGGQGSLAIETGNVTFDDLYCANHADFVPGDYVMLAVSDNGCGMDRETLAHLFEPFFTTKGLGQGTGLGLATVFGAIRQNRGFIHVYSEPGQGTTFRIYLPRFVGPEGISALPQGRIPLRGGSETILLAEDEPAVLNLVKALLERLGYKVLPAVAPEEAIQLAESYRGPIHLLITDVIMPGMTGRDLAKRLASIQPAIRLLFMSGYTADVIADHGVLAPGIHFIEKPVRQDQLAAKVREVLDQAASPAFS